MATASSAPVDEALKGAFIKFCQMGVPGATNMNGKNFSKICKDSGILDGKKVTTMDVDIEFSKRVPKGQKMEFKDFKIALETLAKKRGVDVEALYEKVKATTPALVGVTKTTKVGGVERMTDTSKYTGSHRERFDSTGKGKGAEGREEIVDNSGYVGNYRGSGTYDNTH